MFFARLSALPLVLVTLAATATAAPWQRLIPFQRVEADPKKDYRLTENHGPWLIMAASFAGEGSERQARELVLELRRDFRLPAFIHKRRYDFTEPVQGRHVDRYGRPKRMRYQQKVAFDEYAVLVGEYESIESPGLAKTLDKIKYMRPKAMAIKEGVKNTQRFVALRFYQQLANANAKKRQKGPMGRAFATRNPMVRQEQAAQSSLSPLVLQMNQDADYTLLDCPGKYTVKVASFRGRVIIDQKKIKEIEEGAAKIEHRLNEAAEKATRLVAALRQKNVEAYVFHDRFESMVTVGSFDWVTRSLPNGKVQIHPQIERVMKLYGAQQEKLAGAQKGLKPRYLKGLQGIPFSVQPMPVAVPRRSLSAEFARAARQ